MPNYNRWRESRGHGELPSYRGAKGKDFACESVITEYVTRLMMAPGQFRFTAFGLVRRRIVNRFSLWQEALCRNPLDSTPIRRFASAAKRVKSRVISGTTCLPSRDRITACRC